jgi:hypothetical protein
MPDCAHLLCELIGGACSLATRRSRGCRPTLAERALAPDTLDEVRALVDQVEVVAPDDGSRSAAVRLAAIIRREALEDRNLIALASGDEPELGRRLVRLCFRRKPG